MGAQRYWRVKQRQASNRRMLRPGSSALLRSGALIDSPARNEPTRLFAYRWARVCLHRGRQHSFDIGVGMNPSSGQTDCMGADMRIGIADNESNRTGQNLCLIRTTRSLLASIAGQRVQGGAANATVRIFEHRNQVVHDLRHEEVIEKLTAPKAHISAVMPKTFSYCRKSVETRTQQSTMRTPGVVRDRQLVQKRSVLIAHVVLGFAPQK